MAMTDSTAHPTPTKRQKKRKWQTSHHIKQQRKRKYHISHSTKQTLKNIEKMTGNYRNHITSNNQLEYTKREEMTLHHIKQLP